MRLPIATNATVVSRLGALIRRFRREFIVMISLQFLVAVAAVVTPWVIGTTVDQVAQGAPFSAIRRNITVLIVAVLVQATLIWFADFKARALGQRIFHVLRVDLVSAVTALPLSVVESAGTGDLLGRTTSDVDRIEFAVRQGISRIAVLSLTVLVTVAAAVVAEPRLGFILLITLIPMYFVLRKYLRRTIAPYLATSAINAEISGDVTETVEQSATVDALNMRHGRIARTWELTKERWENERYTALMRSYFSGTNWFVFTLPLVLTIVVGAWLVGLDLTTIGAVTTVALYAAQVRWPLDEIGWWIDELQFAAVSLARIFGVAEIDNSREIVDGEPEGDDILISGVDFSYVDGKPVLKDVNLSVASGEKIAVVGPSGAGKSTLGRLIAGVNAPSAGQVLVGGRAVTTLPEAVLHRTVALVTQENHIFVGTIADNLRLAAPEATDEELLSALRVVEADWISNLEDGIETRVGSGELELAPDRAQQLALARIVLLDPQILVLDEATSLLDPSAARSAERALARVLEGRTVISIAHRLYTAYDADRVAVMIDGEVVELGSHAQLVELGGEYASLWETWQQD